MKLRFKLVEKFSNRDCSGLVRESVNTKDAIKLRERYNSLAILYGWKYKNQEDIEISPEEHTSESLLRRINQIVNDYSVYNNLSSRGNRYAKPSDFIFYILYNDKPYKFGVNENYFDLSESLKENLYFDDIEDENMKEIFNYIMDECREKRLVPFSAVRDMMNEKGIKLEKYTMSLFIDDTSKNGLLMRTIEGDLYIGTPSLLDEREEEIAIVKKEERRLDNSIQKLEDKIDAEVKNDKYVNKLSHTGIAELVPFVKYIKVQAPRRKQYSEVISKIFGGDADKVQLNNKEDPKAKWGLSATIYFNTVEGLPSSIKSAVSSDGKLNSIGLAIELWKEGAILSPPKAKRREDTTVESLEESKKKKKNNNKKYSWIGWWQFGGCSKGKNCKGDKSNNVNHYVNDNAGDVLYNVDMFNHMTGSDGGEFGSISGSGNSLGNSVTAGGDAGAVASGGGMGECLHNTQKEVKNLLLPSTLNERVQLKRK